MQRTFVLAVFSISVLATTQSVRADEQLRREAGAAFGRIERVAMAAGPEAEPGRALFWDTRLSSDGKTPCASCHPAADWGADPRRFSTDARGALTPRQSPTVFNALTRPALR